MKEINLLHEFFNSQSDVSSPLEASEQEEMEVKFQEWFKLKIKDFHFTGHLLMQSVCNNFDPYQTLMVTYDKAEILRAEQGVQTEEYIPD